MKRVHVDQWLRCALPLATRNACGVILNNHAQNAEQIRTQVDALAPFFEFIDYEELKRRQPFAPRRKKPFCLLSFDDGKAVNADETAPELLRLGVPAIFFLSTGLVGTEQVHWFDRLAALRRAGCSELPGLAFWKSLPWQERDQKLDALCRESGAVADRSDSTVRMMGWADALRMQRDGFEIGSHTACHSILTVESGVEVTAQLTRSRQSLRAHGLRARSFAFPNGNCSKNLVDFALKAGFESTFSTVPTWLTSMALMTCLPRLYMRENADAAYLYGKLLAARSGFLLKNPNGTGRRYRSQCV